MRLVLLFMFISITARAQDPWKNVYSSHAWEARDKWQKPQELIRLLNLNAYSHVADIGCHEGYMTFKLAKVVSNGRVYAVDVDEKKLDKMKLRIAQNKIQNVAVVKGDYDNPKIESTRLDAAIILDTYHEMDDHDAILKHIKDVLKPGGRLVLCEPIAEERRKLSRAEQESRHELGMNYAIEDLKKTGFRIIYQKDPFVDRTGEKGDKMWAIVAVRD